MYACCIRPLLFFVCFFIFLFHWWIAHKTMQSFVESERPAVSGDIIMVITSRFYNWSSESMWCHTYRLQWQQHHKMFSETADAACPHCCETACTLKAAMEKKSTFEYGDAYLKNKHTCMQKTPNGCFSVGIYLGLHTSCMYIYSIVSVHLSL